MRGAVTIGMLAGATLAGVAAAQAIKPGNWQTTTAVVSAEMPGVPAQALAMMKKPRTLTHCVTAEEAARDPRALMGTDKSCKVQSYSMSGGKMSAKLVCAQPGGGSMTVTSAGTYSPTAFNVTSTIVMTGAQSMRMTSTVTSKLIGACK